jgi:hypothetical protein
MMKTTSLDHPPTESPRISPSKSNRRALKEWGNFLGTETDARGVSQRLFAAAKSELHRGTPRPARTWDEEKLIDFALNSPYPDDIEEQIEQSWRR